MFEFPWHIRVNRDYRALIFSSLALHPDKSSISARFIVFQVLVLVDILVLVSIVVVSIVVVRFRSEIMTTRNTTICFWSMLWSLLGITGWELVICPLCSPEQSKSLWLRSSQIVSLFQSVPYLLICLRSSGVGDQFELCSFYFQPYSARKDEQVTGRSSFSHAVSILLARI